MHILGTKVCQSFWFKRQMNRVIARYNLLETSKTKEKIWMSLSNVSFPQPPQVKFPNHLQHYWLPWKLEAEQVYLLRWGSDKP